jgi:hypothetical protein
MRLGGCHGNKRRLAMALFAADFAKLPVGFPPVLQSSAGAGYFLGRKFPRRYRVNLCPMFGHA